MEAATGQRPIAGDKAVHIVDAMRASVAVRGVAASTFDHVAREAQVSRGLLHYYFGTKERLLAEKEAAGVLALHAPAGAVADVLFAMADGVAMRMLTEPDRDFGPSVAAGALAIRGLID